MSEMVEVVIDSIRVGLMSQQRVVILREAEADRYLAIWIDPYMAEQITFALQEVEVARPMTHDLIREVVRGMDGRVVRVEVHDLKGDVFYGNIVVEVNGRTIEIDSRPSDALAVAVRTHVPILVARSVLDAAGIIPEEDMDENGERERPLLEETEMTDTRVNPAEERLEAFEDFLSKLDISDDDDENGKPTKGKNN
ncbi:MAG TPA: bifunctional nuclease family protein [Anaerolineales bacterium]|nr:bifunctional nuclease family protein [Anaerolineales bacterium]HRQ92740.1 bifunctional nuclease family protein [Anaerolineales bacterium]